MSDGVVACRDVQCKDPAHRLEIDRYVVELLNNISESGHETIPVKESKPTFFAFSRDRSELNFSSEIATSSFSET